MIDVVLLFDRERDKGISHRVEHIVNVDLNWISCIFIEQNKKIDDDDRQLIVEQFVREQRTIDRRTRCYSVCLINMSSDVSIDMIDPSVITNIGRCHITVQRIRDDFIRCESFMRDRSRRDYRNKKYISWSYLAQWVSAWADYRLSLTRSTTMLIIYWTRSRACQRHVSWQSMTTIDLDRLRSHAMCTIYFLIGHHRWFRALFLLSLSFFRRNSIL
jgi:hypothetical protein